MTTINKIKEYNISTKKTANYKECFEREKKRIIKLQQAEENAKKMEEAHVKNMIDKWGAHRWYYKVSGTDEDCITAEEIRYKEEQYCYEMEQIDREVDLELQIQESNERNIYVMEQTKNMNKEEKLKWLTDYNNNENKKRSEHLKLYWDEIYKHFENEKKEDEKRLNAWYSKQNKK